MFGANGCGSPHHDIAKLSNSAQEDPQIALPEVSPESKKLQMPSTPIAAGSSGDDVCLCLQGLQRQTHPAYRTLLKHQLLHILSIPLHLGSCLGQGEAEGDLEMGAFGKTLPGARPLDALSCGQLAEFLIQFIGLAWVL